MAKINKEEYEILKTKLNEGYEWVTREVALNQWVRVYKRHPDTGFPGLAYPKASDMFVFVKVGDEPYNIAQLIKEYESEETEVKNKAELKSWFEDDKLYVGEYVKHKINQLDEPEVLSQEWIDEHITDGHNVNLGDKVVYADELDGILMPEQEIPVIPKFVAEWIEEHKEREDIYTAISNAFEGVESTEMYNWVSGYTGVANQETFARAWLDGYKIEEEQKYYAKLKEIQPLEKEWLTNLSGPNYYAIDTKGLMLGEFILDLVGMKNQADVYVLKDWERYGINDSNADFEPVEELEE